MNRKKLEADIEKLLTKDELDKALELLRRYFHGQEELDSIILLSGSYESIKKEHQLGLLDFDKVQQVSNQLRKSILSFARAMAKEEDAQPPISEKEKSRQLEQEYKLAMARISVLYILKNKSNIDNIKGLSITDIFTLSKTKHRKYIVEALKELREVSLVEREKHNKIVYWKLSKRGITFVGKFESSYLFSK